MRVDKPNFIIKGQKFTFNIEIENNTNQPQKLLFTSPSTMDLSLNENTTKKFKMAFEGKNVPFEIKVLSDEGEF